MPQKLKNTKSLKKNNQLFAVVKFSDFVLWWRMTTFLSLVEFSF